MSTQLKQVIHYPDTNSVEATWVDEAGVVIKCHSYADVQIDMFRADLVTLGSEPVNPEVLENLITLVESNIKEFPTPVDDSYIAVCSPWQIRKKLNKEGLREAVESYVASEQSTQDERDAWEFATDFREDNPLLVNAAILLGITSLHEFIADAATL